MGRAFANKFSWSNSREKLFRTCLRAYWWRYYGHWGGWSYSASAECRIAYRLGKMDSLPTWAGSIVHDTIQEAIEALRDQGTPIEYERLRSQARNRLRKGWVESRDGQWIRQPKGRTNLQEHYFGDEDALSIERTGEIAERIYTSLKSFCTGPYPKLLARLEPGDFRNVEVLDSLLIDEQTVYVKPDLAFIHPDDGLLWLVDWKTGRPRIEDDLQLATYALFARSKWGSDPSEVRGVLSYLGTGEERRVELSQQSLDEAEQKIRNSMAEMRNLLHDVDENIAIQDDFPQTDDKNRCRRCNFRQFCEGTDGIPGAELAGDPP